MEKKSIILISIVIVVIIGLFFLSNNVNKKNKDNNLDSSYVAINVRNYGNIIVELDPNYAKVTVDNFLKLVDEGFYNGLTFHRIIDGFMIQGGAYLEDGTIKEANTIKGEFSANGVENNLSHKRGVISMARSNDMNSASSQFFIVQEDSTYLDGNYAAFGKVISGMDIVDEIAKNANPIDDNGSISLEDRPVIEEIIRVDISKTSQNINLYEE